MYTARSLEIVRAVSTPSMMGVARELGLFRPRHPTVEGARTLREVLERLGTTFIKLGQLLSTRPDLVSETYAHELAVLQDNIDLPIPAAEVHAIIERSLGRPVEELFSHFDEVPVASASIAQAHYAVCADTGELVVVKVRRPGICEQVEQDLSILESLASRAESHFDSAGLLKVRTIVDELRFSLSRELDLREEAASMSTIARQLSDCELIAIPGVRADMVTAEVLVMERVEGIKVTDALHVPAQVATSLANAFLRAYVRQILVHGMYHADPHAGNVFLTDDGRIALLDFGLVGRIDESTRLEFGLLLLAMAEGRAEDFSDLLLRMSTTDRDSDEQAFEQELRRLLPRYRNTALGSISVGAALVEIQALALRCRIGLPIQFALMGKTLSQVDSIARHLDPGIDPLRIVREQSTDVAWRELVSTVQPSTAMSVAGGPALSLLRLPRRIEHTMEKLERGQITVGIAPTELDDLVKEARTITNRLSVAIVVSAVVIASALLMHVENVGTVAGYPALGFIGFCVACVTGLFLIFRMLTTDGGV